VLDGLDTAAYLPSNRRIPPGGMLGGVSNVDIDRNNTLQIKAIEAVISTFETLPTQISCRSISHTL
jgi:hypothetical protein